MRALFLDRDGVINHDRGYTHRWEDFVFIDGIFDLCRHAKSKGYGLFVITNQAGIGRGFYSEEDFLALTAKMRMEFERQGAAIEKVYYSPYHPEHGIGAYRQDSFLRKPNPGMILLAEQEFALSLKESVLIGDKLHDIRAGVAAGVGCNLLYCPDGCEQKAEDVECKPAAVIARLEQANRFIV